MKSRLSSNANVESEGADTIVGDRLAEDRVRDSIAGNLEIVVFEEEYRGKMRQKFV